MRISSRSISGRAPIALLLGAAWAGLFPGCAPAVNPFQDELQPAQRVTTASVEGARAHGGVSAPLTRTGPAISLAAEGGAVSHFTLYYEDPSIEEGSDDGRMAWTIEDYAWFLAWQPARFLIETVTWPLQAAMSPPWRVQVSDGVLGRRCWDGHHDAECDRG
jgi:hypothetical protein